MNVLLTGGLGFIGSHTVVELVNYKYNVIIIDNLSNSKISVLENIYNLCDKNKITFYEGDILNNNDLNNVFKNINNSKLLYELYKTNLSNFWCRE